MRNITKKEHGQGDRIYGKDNRRDPLQNKVCKPAATERKYLSYHNKPPNTKVTTTESTMTMTDDTLAAPNVSPT